MAEREPAPWPAMPYCIRPMALDDVAAVAEIEREAFPTTWPPTPFRKELGNRIARYLVACRCDVAGRGPVEPAGDEAPRGTGLLGRLLGGLRPGPWGQPAPRAAAGGWDGEAIAGYVGVWFMADEAHITAIATRESCRGKGIGELLIIGAVELALLRGSSVVSLEVRVGNETAQSLYRKYAFRVEGVRKRYYTDNDEDAYIMTTEPIASPAYQERFRGLVGEHQARWGLSHRSLASPPGA